MNRYGQTIVAWGTSAAPALFTGITTDYSYRDQKTRQLDEDMVGDNRALIQHSHKADISFSAKVTDGSTDFLDLSTGAAITIAGIDAGIVLARRTVERWELQQQKKCSVEATHYPDMVQEDPDAAGITATAFTPTPQTALASLIFPGGKLIYGTVGLGHAAGIVHMLQVTQELTITEDDPDPAGTILGATAHGYLRSIELNILAKAAIPAVGSVLTLTGAPANTALYRIETAEEAFREKRGMMYTVGAVWIPPFAA
jgi:hypothetical protein